MADRSCDGKHFLPPSAFPPYLPPGGQVGGDGTATDPIGGPTVGQVVDGLKDQLGGLRGKQQSDVKTDPIVQAREVDCSQLPDETACNECLLRKGMIGPPLTPRYVTHKNLVNYDYQLYVANLRSAPLLFSYLVADQADPERSFSRWTTCSTISTATASPAPLQNGISTPVSSMASGRASAGWWRRRGIMMISCWITMNQKADGL